MTNDELDMNDPAGLFRDIYPVGMVGFTKDEARKIAADATRSAMKTHPDDKSKAAFMAEKIVKTLKTARVCNMYTEAA
jgi:cobalamin biosynthesis Co2+ chelatase CbiK